MKKTIIIGICLLFLISSVSPILTSTMITDVTSNPIPIENGHEITSQNIIFSQKKNGLGLQIGGISTKQKSLSKGDYCKIIPFSFDTSKCNLVSTANGQELFQIEGLPSKNTPGSPMVPMKIIKVPLKNAKVTSVTIYGVHYEKMLNPTHPAISPSPVSFNNGLESLPAVAETAVLDSNSYDPSTYFPGKLFSFKEGIGADGDVLNIYLYPVQYLGDEAILFTDGTIQVVYKIFIGAKVPREITNAENIIITPPEFSDAANQLKEFHTNQGTLTVVVTTEWIDTHYTEADDPPLQGYSNANLPNRNTIHNYNYPLAKKIISYLSDTNAHPALQFVTLLGNGRLVPPSYYSYFPTASPWSPTDFFYTSPDYDFVPNYKVGRLSVNDATQASAVVNKIINWKSSTELFSNVAVAAGNTFNNIYFWGELLTADAINQGVFNGIPVTKYYSTDGKFDKTHLLQSLQGGTGFMNVYTHGNGDQWKLDGTPLSAQDILTLPPNDTTPIVISPACLNGMYDTYLVNRTFSISLGESILLSQAGGIAYIGGTRENYASLTLTLENGRVHVLSKSFFDAMLQYALQAYQNGATTIGEIMNQAMLTYINTNDMTYYLDGYTLFTFDLLGDPALQIPPRPTGTNYQVSSSHTVNPVDYVAQEQVVSSVNPTNIIPVPCNIDNHDSNRIPLCTLGEAVSMKAATNSPTVEMKVINPERTQDFIIQHTYLSSQNNEVSYEFIPQNNRIICIRTITSDSKEDWLYVLLPRVVDDSYDATTPGFGVTRFKTIGDAVAVANNNDYIYVSDGVYHEHLVFNKPINLIGSASSPVIDGDGVGSILTFLASPSLLTGFTIQNSGTSGTDAGIVLSPLYFLIIQNTLTNNNYGIYGQGPSNYRGFIFHNNFIKNSHNAYELGANMWDKILAPTTGEGNYWDDYTGRDTNGDGIGNICYYIPPASGMNGRHDWYPLMIPYGYTSTYTITNVGVLGDATNASYAYDMNLKGQIVGSSGIPYDNQFAFMRKDLTMKNLGVLPGALWSEAKAINSTGTIAGSSHAHACIWENDQIIPLGSLGDGTYVSYGYDINDHGQVVGSSYLEPNQWEPPHAFLWQNNMMTDLGVLPNDTASVAYGINNNGQVVGTSSHAYVDYTASHAFIWSVSTGMVALPPLPGDIYCEAYGINDYGQVVGNSYGEDGLSHAVLWTNGIPISLGSFAGGRSYAYAINNFGEVVGSSSINADGVLHAFTWYEGIMTDLNILIPSLLDWDLSEALNINQAGQIVGYGTYNGQTRGFLMVLISNS